jgi:polysaccharide deacetylase family protein (PEP-CTERM system associated)
VTNVLTVDLEEWHQLAARRVTGELPPLRGSVPRQLDVLLRILGDHSTRATFFVLGMLAERAPELVRRVAAAGHEIALHSYAHLIVDRITRTEFAEDTRQGKQIVEDIIGEPVRGYRAAEFSIRRSSLWALEVLAELGFAYDSSIFPIRHRRYGIAGFAPRPASYALANGMSIVELPLSTVAFGRGRVPVAGGGYQRLAPLWLIRRMVRKLHAEQLPMVSYCHPYEFDPQRLDLREAAQPQGIGGRLRAAQFNFHQNLRRRSMAAKLAALLTEYRFTTCREYVKEVQGLESRELLSATR